MHACGFWSCYRYLLFSWGWVLKGSQKDNHPSLLRGRGGGSKSPHPDSHLWAPESDPLAKNRSRVGGWRHSPPKNGLLSFKRRSVLGFSSWNLWTARRCLASSGIGASSGFQVELIEALDVTMGCLDDGRVSSFEGTLSGVCF